MRCAVLERTQKANGQLCQFFKGAGARLGVPVGRAASTEDRQSGFSTMRSCSDLPFPKVSVALASHTYIHRPSPQPQGTPGAADNPVRQEVAEPNSADAERVASAHTAGPRSACSDEAVSKEWAARAGPPQHRQLNLGTCCARV